MFMNENIDFEKIKEKILPFFIKIYGEEFKEVIFQRMNQIEPIFYSTIHSKKTEMYTIETAKRIELTLEFLELNDISISEEVKQSMIKSNTSYPLREITEARDLLEACYNSCEYRENPFDGIREILLEPTDNEYRIKRNVSILKKLGFEVDSKSFNEWCSKEEAKIALKKIEDLKSKMIILDKQFQEFDSQFADLKQLIDKGNEIEIKLQEKYMLEYLESLEHYTSEEDKKRIEEYKISNEKNWYSFKKQLNILKIVGSSFYEDGLLSAFSEQARLELENSNVKKERKEAIYENRIKYYRIIGLYKNQMPKEQFLLTKGALDYFPSKEFMEDVLSKKEYFAKEAERKIIEITSSYKENIEKIKSLNLATDVSFEVEDMKNRLICINPSIRIINGHSTPIALLFFSKGSCIPEYMDTMFIHEINHAIELSLLEYKEGKAIYKCGFEILDDQKKSRNYKMFSEIINQIIAMLITSAMHQEGVYLFDNPNTSKIQGGTSYEQQIMFVKMFWDTFQKKIMFARVEDCLDELVITIGKENFDKLNDIINEYSSLPYYQMMDDVINNRTTELTKRRESLFQEAISISRKMIEHAEKIVVEKQTTNKKK